MYVERTIHSTARPLVAHRSRHMVDGWCLVRVVSEVAMGCSHANGSHVTCKAVIDLVPSLNWQESARPSPTSVGICGSLSTMPCRKGRPASRKVAPEWRKVDF